MVQNNLEVTSLITPLINAFKAMGNEWKELFDIGLTEYLHNQTDKYYLTNTFLHRFEKVKFFDVYFPIKINYKQLTTQVDNPKEILEEYKYITIIGTAGGGKSTLVKYIFLNSLKSLTKIPVLIELRHLNEYNRDLEKLISEKILKLSAKPSEAILKRALHNGSFLFLLDGYDEIFSDKKQDMNRQVETFVDTYFNNYFIITTRPGSGIERFPRFHDFHVCPLNQEDITSFINLLVKNTERRNRILNTIQSTKNSDYNEYLKNPLLLSMFILAFESHPEIPKKKSAFYRNVFDTLYSKHDGITKNSFPRERKTKLQRDDFENILNIFSYITLKDGTYSYTEEYLSDKLSSLQKNSEYLFSVDDIIYDLETSISIFIKDGFEYKFPHRSMQEYFAAHFISKLSTDKKGKAYTSLTSKLKETSEDSGQTLWELCKELDFSSFMSHFIIPELITNNNNLDDTNDVSLLSSFLKLTKPELFYQRHNSIEFIILLSNPYYENLIKFTEIDDFMNIKLFITDTKQQKGVMKILPKKVIERIHKGNNMIDTAMEDISANTAFQKLLLNHNMSSRIKEIKAKTLKKINDLEQEIEIRNNNIDDFLAL